MPPATSCFCPAVWGPGRRRSCEGSPRGWASILEEVASPTFTLIHEYRGGRLALYHADLYRLERAATEDIGLEEMGVADGVLAIEWPDRLTHAMPGARRIVIDIVDDTKRRIQVGSRQ